MNKTQALRVRLTPEEGDAFKKIAEDVGETRARLLRKMIREVINKDIDLLTDEQSLLLVAIRQLIGMANNLNQITAAIHGGKTHRTIDEEYLTELRGYVSSIKVALESEVKKTRNRWVKNACDTKKK